MMLRRVDFGWFGIVITFVLGVGFLALTYNMYEDSVWQDEMSGYSPVVCMKITGRSRGIGTVKYPDKISAEFEGKAYQFSMGRKNFRRLAGVDTVAVYYDAASDRAVLPSTTGYVKHYAFLYIMIATLGLILISSSISETRKRVKIKHPISKPTY